MQPYSSENGLAKRARSLMQALILSGTLNIGLMATFAYFVLKEKQSVFSLHTTSSVLPISNLLTNKELLQKYSQLSYQDLLLHIENKELIEEGLTRRDLSLACLVAFHHFNLETALGGEPLQRRTLPFSNLEGQETILIAVFPGLSDDQFQAVLHYAKLEKWPFTPQGLFYEIKRCMGSCDPSLLQAFYLTPEYHAVHTLFIKTGIAVSSEQIIALIKETDWKDLNHFTQQQRFTFDLSIDRRRALLLTFLEKRSKTAAQLLLDSDSEFILKRLEDSQILTILDLYPESNESFENFAKELIASPRTDAVWKSAAKVLYTRINAQLPDPYDHSLVIQQFLPEKIVPKASILAIAKPALVTVAPPSKRIHIVASGENLWKIARKYHVTVEEIMHLNGLDTEKLRPGKQLEIPSKT